MDKIFNSKIKRQIILMVLDVCIVVLSEYASLAVRFMLDSSKYLNGVPEQYMMLFWRCLPIDVAITIVVFWAFRLYHSVWTFASIEEITKIIESVAVVTVVEVAYKAILAWNMPRSFYIFNAILLFILVLFSRLSIRIINHYRYSHMRRADGKRTMIVGGGSAGSILMTELSSAGGGNSNVVAIIDDNEHKKGKYLQGVKIYGNRTMIPEIAEEKNIEEIVIALPSAMPDDISDIVEICNRTECKVKILPSIALTLEGALAETVRDISYKDLLGRELAHVDNRGIEKFVKNEVIMVTGGGGSIGSEICRQIAGYDPKQLVIFDIYENNAYELEMELKRTLPGVKVAAIIGSVRDYDRLEVVFKKYRPDVVYHAAAHKHVPLMETSPAEAIKNNCQGTLNTAKLADKYGAEKFILISTDKAVRPTNIMGASKRICEMIIQTWAQKSSTKFTAVRFGNVLGSNGSVIPLFLKQIESGGPVTVTHRDITRFFMTIPEAVSLVLQAGLYAKGGEIYVLDMGKQVKIYDLAENLIRMKGYKPGKDIRIEIVGLRPGEKLYEELLMDEEGLAKTENEMIYIGQPLEFGSDFQDKLDGLIEKANENDENIKELTAQIVETYTVDKRQNAG